MASKTEHVGEGPANKEQDDKHVTDEENHEKLTTEQEHHEKHSIEKVHSEKFIDKGHHEKHSIDKGHHEKHSIDKGHHEKHSIDKGHHEKHSIDKGHHEKHSIDKGHHEKHSIDKGHHEKHSIDRGHHEKQHTDQEHIDDQPIHKDIEEKPTEKENDEKDPTAKDNEENNNENNISFRKFNVTGDLYPEYDHKNILTPNPDFEEDLMLHTIVTPEMEERIESYTAKFKKKKRPKPPCKCQVEPVSLGGAPWIKLNNGFMMPSFGLGTWLGLDENGKPIRVTDNAVQLAVEAAIDEGYRHIDTAAIYHTEAQVGRAINKKIAEGVIKRSDIFVTTKLWNDKHARKDVVPALKMSLEKLNLTYVDLYLIHWPFGVQEDGTYDMTDYLETWEGMIEARDMALTRSIGVSNFTQHMIDRIISLTSAQPQVLQIEGAVVCHGDDTFYRGRSRQIVIVDGNTVLCDGKVNLNLQQPDLLRYCRQQNILVTAYTPFGSLFHKRAHKRAPPPRSSDRILVALADKYKKTVPQIALRYLVELGVVPIPKSLKQKRIAQNLAIFDFSLSASDRTRLRAYDVGYRTNTLSKCSDHPYYPFQSHLDAMYQGLTK